MQEKQPLWTVRLKVDKFVWKPGDKIKIGLNVRNVSDSALYFSRAEVAPSWAKDKRGIKPIKEKNYLASGDSIFIAEFNLQLPSTPGLYTMKFGLETWVYNNYTTNWKNLGVRWTSNWGYIQVTLEPEYTVFVSCSLRKEDKPCIDQIRKLLRLWGFKPVTFGINKFSEDPLKIPQNIDEEIKRADAVIGIATPRDYSIQDKTYKTFTWLHLETKKGCDSDKPLLFIVDERIKPEGLLEYHKFPKVFYNPTKLDVLEHRLAIVMPGFRKWIAEKKRKEFDVLEHRLAVVMPGFRKWIAEKERKEFVDGLVKAGLILGGIWLVGKSMEENE